MGCYLRRYNRVPFRLQITNCIRVIFAAVCLLGFANSPADAAAEAKHQRVALVIGNSRYEPAIGPLRNTVNDAKAMAKTLRTLSGSDGGFHSGTLISPLSDTKEAMA